MRHLWIDKVSHMRKHTLVSLVLRERLGQRLSQL